MKSKAIQSYVWVGTCLRFLQDAQAGWAVHDDSMVLPNIRAFLEHVDDIGLHVTKRACFKLTAFQSKIEQKPRDTNLTSEEAGELSTIMTDIRKTFEAETQGFFAYVVTDKRVDVNKLLNNISGLFKPDLFVALPEIARYDYKEAGLCIAFERPTAAAFHILRGTEDVLRMYYKKHIRPAKQGLTWGQITTELRQKIKGKKPDPVLIQNLDNIRNSFRNPTQHPDKIYDIQEAQDLLMLCVEAVNRMASAK